MGKIYLIRGTSTGGAGPYCPLPGAPTVLEALGRYCDLNVHKRIAVTKLLAHPVQVRNLETEMRVIAKAYGGEPLDQILTGRANGLAYVINPSAVDSGDISEFSGVGFPLDAVFHFDIGIFECLQAAWKTGDHPKLERSWAEARGIATESIPENETAMSVA